MMMMGTKAADEEDDEEDSEWAGTTRTCHCPTWTLEARHWVYRGEGNASIVLALPQERMIARLIKMDKRLRRMDSDNQFLMEEINGGIRTIGETLERVVFSQRILGPLLGAGLVRPCHVYHVDLEEIERIGQALDNVRPAHRKHKRLAPVCHAVVCEDCTLLPSPSRRSSTSPEPVFCVELKPKQGFLSGGHEHCPFCLNQFLKRKHGKIQLLSQYCPLDLFSGSRVRMLRAISALIRTPQNNLRIFQDGNLVFAEECQTELVPVLKRWFHLQDTTPTDQTLPLRSFGALLMEALTMELPDGCGPHHPVRRQVVPVREEDWADSGKPRDHYAPCPSPPASASCPSSSVLSKMLRVQSLGDVDFARLYDAYDALVDRFTDGSFSYDQVRWTHPRMTVDWLLSAAELDHTIQDVQLVQRYRISSTARDCSIMIAFQRLTPEELAGCAPESEDDELLLELNDEEGTTFRCRISVVDLDPKPVSCVDKHRRRNQAMNEAFQLSFPRP